MRFSDLDRVYALEKKLFPNPWPKSFFESDLQMRKTIAFVVESNKEIIGYSIASCQDAKCHITNIAVDESQQRKGIGKRLMGVLESSARERGCGEAYLEVRTDNKAAVALYETLGYNISHVQSHYYIDGDDAYVMVKDLSNTGPRDKT
jgi:ribosomal-protein-alanine N-acetyltransferase